jgi:hypothetical protein
MEKEDCVNNQSQLHAARRNRSLLLVDLQRCEEADLPLIEADIDSVSSASLERKRKRSQEAHR